MIAAKGHPPGSAANGDQPATRDGRKVRAQQRREQRKAQILDVARSVFSRHGYHASSVADILKQASIARGTFYLYFPSKRALFDALLDEMFAQINAAIFRIDAGRDDESVVAQMHRNVLGVVQVLQQNRELTIILLREAEGIDADFDQKLATFYDRLAGLIQQALALGQGMGLIRPCDRRLVSYCVLGSIKEVMRRVLEGGAMDEQATRAVAQEIMAYNVFGLFSS